MLGLGVGHGDRVGMLALNEPEYFDLYFGLAKIGAILVPINYRLAGPEIQYILSDCAAKVFVFGHDYAEVTDSFRNDIQAKNFIAISDTPPDWAESYETLIGKASDEEPEMTGGGDDTLTILYTSGTTGRPKGAELTHLNYYWNSVNITATLAGAGDTMLVALPLFHVHGLGFALHTSLLAGAHVLLLDQFSPPRVIEALSKKAAPCVCTVFMAVPAMYVKLMDYLGDKKPDFEHIRLWTSGSAPLLAKDFERIHRIFGKKPVEREGMSETGMNFSNPLKGKRKTGSIGLPLPALRSRLERFL